MYVFCFRCRHRQLLSTIIIQKKSFFFQAIVLWEIKTKKNSFEIWRHADIAAAAVAVWLVALFSFMWILWCHSASNGNSYRAIYDYLVGVDWIVYIKMIVDRSVYFFHTDFVRLKMFLDSGDASAKRTYFILIHLSFSMWMYDSIVRSINGDNQFSNAIRRAVTFLIGLYLYLIARNGNGGRSCHNKLYFPFHAFDRRISIDYYIL